MGRTWTWPGSNWRPPHCERGALPTELQARQWNRQELNLQPPACKTGALPVELRPRDAHVSSSPVSGGLLAFAGPGARALELNLSVGLDSSFPRTLFHCLRRWTRLGSLRDRGRCTRQDLNLRHPPCRDGALPLCYACEQCERRDSNPRWLECGTSALPLGYAREVPQRGFEPRTYGVSSRRSSKTELPGHERSRGESNSPHPVDSGAASPDAYESMTNTKADDASRTRNIQLGRLTLCQLSYIREGRWTGLEPAVIGSTNRGFDSSASNASGQRDSNPQPPHWQRGALPLSYVRDDAADRI